MAKKKKGKNPVAKKVIKKSVKKVEREVIKEPKINEQDIILRKGYSINFLNGKETNTEEKIRKLFATDKAFQQIHINHQTNDDSIDEIIVLVKD